MKYEKFYYELKKNCRGKYRFKKSFPIVETITDEMGLRVGKKSFPKNEGFSSFRIHKLRTQAKF